MKLPKSLEAYGTDEFDEVVAEELKEKTSLFDADHLTKEGGGTDDEDLDIGDVTDLGDSIEFTVWFSFTECLSSGCRDITIEKPRSYKYSVTIQKDDASAEIDNITEDRYDEEF